MTEMTFKEKLEHMKKNYDGIGSIAFYQAQGGVKCKVMSWYSYLSCIDELMKIIKEHPEILKEFADHESKDNDVGEVEE